MGQAKRKQQKQEDGREATAEPVGGGWCSPALDNYLTIVAAVAFQFVVILLPLVGPAGSATPHATQNRLAWLGVLAIALALSGLAFFSKLQRRRQDGSPFPVWSTALLAGSLFFMVAHFGGLLKI